MPRAMPTIVMMRRLIAKHSCCDFKFVVGSDLLSTLKEWDAPALPGPPRASNHACAYRCIVMNHDGAVPAAGHWEAVEDAGNVFYRETNLPY